MALLDKLRSKPAWQHADAVIRASAVRQLGTEHQELFTTIATTDADPHVRKVAVSKIDSVETLARIGGDDAEAIVKGEAAARLAKIAAEDSDEERARAASAVLTDPKALLLLAKTARLGSVRRAALERISDPRGLATLAKNAEEGVLRLEALARIDDQALIAEVAGKAESRDVAVAAVDRLEDREALAKLAEKSRNKAASRRAAVRLSGLRAADAVPAPKDDASEDEIARYEEAKAAMIREAEALETARRSREALVERVQKLRGETIPASLMAIRGEWTELPAFDSDEGRALQARFDTAAGNAQARFDALGPSEERRTAAEAICVEAEEIAATDAEPGEGRKRLAELRASLPAFAEYDDWKDALLERFARAEALFAAHDKLSREEREQQVRANQARLNALIEKIEALAKAETVALKDAALALRETKEALDQTGPLPTKKEREEVVARLKAARGLLYPRVQELREADDWTRWANVAKQEELIVRMEALKEPIAGDRLVRSYREIQEEWKQYSQVPKNQAQLLWQRYKAARDQVSGKVRDFLVARRSVWAESLAKKEALCVRAEALAESTNWVETAKELQKLQNEWKASGPVSRKHSEKIWQRFRTACDVFFKKRKEDLDKRKGVWDENLAKKEALCVQAEALSQSLEWEKTAKELQRLQAEWKKVGPVRKSKSEVLWKRFRTACDGFFERFKKRYQIASDERGTEAVALCAELEGLLPPEGEALAEDFKTRVQDVLSRWKALSAKGPLPKDHVDRLFAARAAVAARDPGSFAGTELDPQMSKKRLEKLVKKVESLIPRSEAAPAADSVASLAQKLQAAMSGSAIGGRAEAEARKRAAVEEVKAAQAALKRLGALPDDDSSAALQKRFRDACDRFFAAQRA